MTTQLQTEQGIVRVPSGTWAIDPIHSSVGFEVKHMMISTVRGHFKQYEGTLEAAEEYQDSHVWGSVQVASIDTNNAERDDVFVTSLIAHDADGSDRQEHGEGLPDFFIKSCGSDLL